MYRIEQRLEKLEKQVDKLLRGVQIIIHQNNKIMGQEEQIKNDIQKISDALTSESDSIGKISQELIDLKNQPPADQSDLIAKLDDLATRAQAASDSLASLVPAAPQATAAT